VNQRKHFDDFHPQWEQYNPERMIGGATGITNTFDENGQLHSFDDKPSSITSVGHHNISYELEWRSHGKLFREEGKPFRVVFSKTHYATYNEHWTSHSFNDQPSLIDISGEGYTRLIWHKDELEHRENDKPAIVTWNFSRFNKGSRRFYGLKKFYLVNELAHRSHGKPAVETDDPKSGEFAWLVEGVYHNLQGPATLYKAVPGQPPTRIWSLYGIALTERYFHKIKELKKVKQVPCWVAVLLVLKFIDDEHLAPFMTKDNLWEPNVSTNWLFHFWGLNDEMFQAKMKIWEKEIKKPGTLYEQHFAKKQLLDLESFLKVIKSDEADALEVEYNLSQTTKKEINYV
jgi:hypothetical protein